MLLGEVMDGLRDVRDGKAVMTPEQADNVLDAIYLLLERNKITEEKLAYYKGLEREGRLKVRPPMYGRKCGTCESYDIIPGSACGHCKVREDKHRPGKQLYVYRSRGACKDYVQKEEKTK